MSNYEQSLTAIGQAADAELAAQDALIADLRQQIIDLTPAPKPPRGMLVGSSLYREGGESHDQAYQRRLTQWGVTDMGAVRYFYPGMPSGWPTFGTAATVASFKPTSVQDLLDGKLDTLFNLWLDSLPVKKPLRVACWHEREDDIEDGRFTKDQALAMDLHVYDLIEKGNERNGTNVRFGLILMGWTLDPRSERLFDNYVSDEFHYDWLGFDAYPGDAADQDVPDLSATKENYGRCAQVSKDYGAPFWICETGTRPAPGQPADVYDARQAQWITGATQVARDLGCKGWTYFDSVVGGDFRIKGPLASAAMKQAIEPVTLSGNMATARGLYPPLDDR